jgi:hypothetical protein
MQLLLFKNTLGDWLERQDVQLFWRLEQVRQKSIDEHALQIWLTGTNPAWQLTTQFVPYKFNETHDKHLYWNI